MTFLVPNLIMACTYFTIEITILETRLGFLRTKTKLVIWSVKSWTLNFWSLIWNYLISSWSSWSLILLIFDLWWTLIRWSVKRLDLWSFDLSWSLLLIFWSRWSLNCDLSFQLELSFVERNHRNTERLHQVLSKL